MLNIIRNLLSKAIEDIDTGNSNITEEDERKIIGVLTDVTETKLSKYQACQMLNIGRSAFDKLVREGELPRGLKQTGFKELFWRKSDIVKYLAVHN